MLSAARCIVRSGGGRAGLEDAHRRTGTLFGKKTEVVSGWMECLGRSQGKFRGAAGPPKALRSPWYPQGVTYDVILSASRTSKEGFISANLLPSLGPKGYHGQYLTFADHTWVELNSNKLVLALVALVEATFPCTFPRRVRPSRSPIQSNPIHVERTKKIDSLLL